MGVAASPFVAFRSAKDSILLFVAFRSAKDCELRMKAN
jgi:hypothetical protein